MRLAKGRNRRLHYYTFCIPADQLELPGSWAELRLSISADGVTVHSLKLSMSFPATSRTGSRQQYRLCA